MRSGVPDCRLQPEARLPRLPESHRRACEARPRQILASQVPRDVRDAVSMGRGRSAYCPAVAWSLRHVIDESIFESLTESAGPCAGKPDFRLIISRFVDRHST